MKFFDEHGNAIECQQWLKTYETYYFLHGPNWGRRINAKNQTSRFVENQVCDLLTRTAPLSRQDLILAMAWKIGLIDHGRSEAIKTIEYRQDWPTTLTAKGQFRTLDFSTSIPYLAANMRTILTQTRQDNPEYVFNLAPQLQGFGYVYILTILFFVTHGQFPIYDRYAHIAALAIDQGLPPESYVNYREGQKWSDYKHYMNVLLHISKACPQQLGDPLMFISRPADRALWVYGHFFKTGASTVRATKGCATPSAPIMAGSSNLLLGRIRDLGQSTGDGWKRREIIIRQRSDGYPRERDHIRLIDSSGGTYDLPLIKGAGVQGYTCLGRPGTLKPWFTRHYSAEEVEGEKVYFKPTGRPNEYRIYTEVEWKAGSEY